MVLVLVNQRSISIPVKLKIEGKSSFVGDIYLTSAKSDQNMAFTGEIKQDDLYEIPAKSIVTINLR